MRLDKFLCEMQIGTRSQVKLLIKQGQIKRNGLTVKSADLQIDEVADQIQYKDEILVYQKYSYYMLHKPEGVVSATQDNTCKTVLELLPKERRKDIFPVGRLDKDTTGLLLLTNDGELSHRLLSPKKHVDKIYEVTIERALSEEDIIKLSEGVNIGEEKLTLPAKVQVLEDKKILLTIREGKFHQVKRMLQAVDNQVLVLKRIAFGPLQLDETLEPGAYRLLTEDEVKLLHDEG